MHYSCVVINLLNTGLDKSAFSTYSFEKMVFRPSAFLSVVFQFHLDKLYNIYIIVVFSFSHYKNQVAITNIALKKNKLPERFRTSKVSFKKKNVKLSHKMKECRKTFSKIRLAEES